MSTTSSISKQNELIFEMKHHIHESAVVSPRNILPMTNADEDSQELKNCIATLKLTPWFMFCSDKILLKVAKKCLKETYEVGDIIIKQGDRHDKMFVVSSGSVARWRNIEGSSHLMEIDERGGTGGFYYIMNAETCYATAKCMNSVECYSISRDELLPLFNDPDFSKEVVVNLNLEIRRQIMTSCELGRTPLLEQQAKPTSYIITSIAASVESFYRSGMNAAINASLSGSKNVARGALFPNMHLQIPTRVVYINGLKGLRQQIQYSDVMQNIDTYSNKTAIRCAAAVAPGLLMTPMSRSVSFCPFQFFYCET